MGGAPAVEVDGAKLRELRKVRGENLRMFAARAGITVQYLSQIELGVRRRVSPPTFVKICDALGVADRQVMMASNTEPYSATA